MIVTLLAASPSMDFDAFGHQDGCHRWHSCPSDSGSYTCGDKGYCSECSDNQYCEAGKPRTSSSSSSTTSSSSQSSSDNYWQKKYLETLSDFNEVSYKVEELQKENMSLKNQISDLEKTIDSLNLIIQEQVKVIYDWIRGN